MDWTTIILAAIAAVPPTLTALIAFYKISNRITSLHVEINSRMTEIIKLSREGGFAEGAASERKKS
jgi:hypothetical protein